MCLTPENSIGGIFHNVLVGSGNLPSRALRHAGLSCATSLVGQFLKTRYVTGPASENSPRHKIGLYATQPSQAPSVRAEASMFSEHTHIDMTFPGIRSDGIFCLSAVCQFYFREIIYS